MYFVQCKRGPKRLSHDCPKRQDSCLIHVLAANFHHDAEKVNLAKSHPIFNFKAHITARPALNSEQHLLPLLIISHLKEPLFASLAHHLILTRPHSFFLYFFFLPPAEVTSATLFSNAGPNGK